jgi:NAD(P)H dehydrogenase (quinone)
LEADLVLLGSPTYFGALSGKMKEYLESTSVYWMQSSLAGKHLIAFTTAANNEGGAHLCLQSIHTFGLHQGMFPVPLPFVIAQPLLQPAYGLVHYTGEEAMIRPTEQLYRLVERWIDWVLATLKR